GDCSRTSPSIASWATRRPSPTPPSSRRSRSVRAQRRPTSDSVSRGHAVTPKASAAWPHHVVARRADTDAVLEPAAAARAPPPDQPEAGEAHGNADAGECDRGLEWHRLSLVRDSAGNERRRCRPVV